MSSLGFPELASLSLACLMPVLLAGRVPPLIPPDGLDYLDGAASLLRDSTAARVVPYKAPGLTFLTASVLKVDATLGLLVWVQGALVVCTAVLAWASLRLIGSRWVALIVATLVAWHPSILTYRPYLLREAGATFLSAMIAFMVLATFQAYSSPRSLSRGLSCSALLGLGIGVGALYRENFVAFAPLGAVTAAVATLQARAERTAGLRITHALVAGTIVLAAATITMLPWLAYNQSRVGVFALTVPKTQFNRCINAWANGLIDDGATRPRAPSDYAFVASILASHGVVTQEAARRNSVDAVIDAMVRDPFAVERLCKTEVDVAIASRPRKAVRDCVWSLASQMACETCRGTRPRDRTSGIANRFARLVAASATTSRSTSTA